MRMLDYNPLTGESVSFKYDDESDTVTIGHHQDVSAILEANKLDALDIDMHRRAAKGDTLTRYARVPNIVQLHWLQEYGVRFHDKNHWPKVMELINSPDYKYLKTTTYHHDR